MCVYIMFDYRNDYKGITEKITLNSKIKCLIIYCFADNGLLTHWSKV